MKTRRFSVLGLPAPQGSKTHVAYKHYAATDHPVGARITIQELGRC